MQAIFLKQIARALNFLYFRELRPVQRYRRQYIGARGYDRFFDKKERNPTEHWFDLGFFRLRMWA